ncbi:hypothetical protein ELP17_35745, partial [Klebsiella pneumoniae]|nr:hypothetical protein [Klebsiella pneumoniae]
FWECGGYTRYKKTKGDYNLQTYTWNLGDASLTFYNGTMVPFQKGELATTTRDMMYFYYDVLLQVRQETRRILVRNHPTAHYIT